MGIQCITNCLKKSLLISNASERPVYFKISFFFHSTTKLVDRGDLQDFFQTKYMHLAQRKLYI